jgi:YesN/AraC family two-component response regulator
MLKVLVVEDEAGIRNALLTDYDWASLDCSVSCASSGIEAIEQCIQSAPDIVITDIVIPGIDGITLIKYLKYKRTNALFIIMTGHRDFEFAKDSLNLGAFAFLLKPIKHEEFLDVVTRAIDAVQKADGGGGAFSEEQLVSNLLLGLPVGLELADETLRHTLLSFERYRVALADFDYAEDRNSENLKNLYVFLQKRAGQRARFVGAHG